MVLATLNTYINILSNIVQANKPYIEMYQILQKTKQERGTVFPFLNKDGIPKIYELNSRTLMPFARNGNQLVYMQHVLDNITHDFSVLTAMTNAEWIELTKHIYDAGIRAVLPEDRHSSSETSDGQEMIKLYVSYPWVVVTLLLETMYYTTSN